MRLVILFFLLSNSLFAVWSKTYIIQVDRTLMGSSTLTNFPVLISASDPTLKSTGNGGFVTSGSGFDIVVATDATLATYVPWEVEFWDAANGIIVFWAQIPSVNGSGAGSNTTFAVAWGNSAITTQQNTGSFAPANVWDSSYKGVWHLPDGTTLSLADSTTNANNGTNHGLITSVGQIDGSTHANVPGHYADVGATGFPTGATSWTVSAWFNSAGSGGNHAIFCACNAAVVNAGPIMLTNGTNFFAGGVAHYLSIGFGTFVWHYAVATYDGTNLNVYVDGSILSGSPSAQSISTTLTATQIGNDGFGDLWAGDIDEVRFSSGIARSGDWQLSEYNNQRTPGDINSPGFLIWGNHIHHNVHVQ